MIQLIFPRKKWVTINKFAHDAGNCPHINLSSIISSDKKFRRSIPSGGYVIGDLLSFFFFDLTCEPEIANFKLKVRRYKEILWLYVAMDYVLLMQVIQPLNKLKHKFSDEGKFYSIGGFL